MFYILRRNGSDVAGGEATEPLPSGGEPQAHAAAPSVEPGIQPSRLFYIRRFGPIMGMCLYELDASLRASGGSARR